MKILTLAGLAMSSLAVLADETTLSVAADETYTLAGDETYETLEVASGATIDLAGHSLTITKTFSPSSSYETPALVTNSVDGTMSVMKFELTTNIGKTEFTKAVFGGDLQLSVNANFTADNFMRGCVNTYTGGTILDHLRTSNSKVPRIDTVTSFGSGAMTFANGSVLRDVKQHTNWLYPWTALTSLGDGEVNVLYMEGKRSIGEIPVVIEKGNTFRMKQGVNDYGDWSSADYSKSEGTLWFDGDRGQVFEADYPGTLMLSGHKLWNNSTPSGYVWTLGALASPDTVTESDTSAQIIRDDGNLATYGTLVVGSANTDATWYGQIKWGNKYSKQDWAVKKVGTGTWTIGGLNDYRQATEIAEGAIKVLAGATLGNGGSINLTGGALILGDGLDAALTSRVSAGIPANLGVDRDESVTITNTLAGITQGLVKIGGGTLTLTEEAVDFTGNVRVEAGTLVIPAKTSVSATLDESAVLVIGETVIGTKIGHTGDITVTADANGNISVEQAKDEAALTAITWTGAVSTEWTEAGNWEGGVVPGVNDNVLFDGDATVTWENRPNNIAISNLFVNGAVTFVMPAMASTETSDRGLMLQGIEGGAAGKIVLKGARLSTVKDVSVRNELPIVVAPCDSESFITAYGEGSGSWYQKGPLSGNGTMRFRHYTSDWKNTGVYLEGDNSAFEGTGVWEFYRISGGCFVSPESGSAKATWIVEESKQTKRDRIKFTDVTDNGTIAFGALIQTNYYGCSYRVNLKNNSSVITLQIGGNGTDSVIMGAFGDESLNANCNVRKVGDETLTVYRPYVAKSWFLDGGVTEAIHAHALNCGTAIAFNGGTLRYGIDTVSTNEAIAVTTDWSNRIKNSSAAIAVETTGADVAWATALDASNAAHEIVKSGSGNLTLTAVPAWDDGAEGNGTKVTVKYGSKGRVILPLGAQYTLGSDEGHPTKVATTSTGLVFSNPRSFTIVVR